MSFGIENIFAVVLSLIGPAPADTPKQLQLKPGDQIVAIGDSITQGGGYLRDIDAVLAAQYPELKLPKVINKGISGQKAEDLVRRFDADVVKLKPAYVTISIGINDVWHRLGSPHDAKVLAAYKKNVATMVDQAQQAGIKVILLTPTLIQEDPNSEGNKRLVQYVEAEKQIAAEKKCQLVDLHGMFLAALKQKPAGEKGNWLTGDGVHMKPLGDGIMAAGALRALGVPDEKLSGGKKPDTVHDAAVSRSEYRTGRFPALSSSAPAFRPRPEIRYVLFDFDGTLSLIRQGWPEVMVPMFVEMLPRRGDESDADLRRLAYDDIMRLNGKQTIFQMMQLAERIRQRGGSPREPLWYKHEYLRRLDLRIGDRIEGLRSGRIRPDELLVHGSRQLLERLSARAHAVPGQRHRRAAGQGRGRAARRGPLLRPADLRGEGRLSELFQADGHRAHPPRECHLGRAAAGLRRRLRGNREHQAGGRTGCRRGQRRGEQRLRADGSLEAAAAPGRRRGCRDSRLSRRRSPLVSPDRCGPAARPAGGAA